MVQVRVSEGVLEGEEVQNEFGGKFYSFKGIPYAKPPLGELRFKAPEDPQPWEGVRNAKEHGPGCYQFGVFFTLSEFGSEDCLYLNVYTPDVSPSSPLPVMFWIHGGGFFCGSGNDDVYGPEFLVRQNVVLVTFNYRLDVLGLLCLDTEDVPGNAGMKDQVAALRWVKKNISNFGGDPDNVTIFGESAGGASTSFHLISPMSKGLFKRAICQSGTANCHWANSFEPRERAIAIAKKLGLDSEDDKKIVEFLRSVPVESLIKISAPILLAEKERPTIQQSIVSEKDFGQERFFYGDAADALANNVHDGVEILAGYCRDEGVIKLKEGFEHMVSKANNFLEMFVPIPLAMNCPLKTQMEIGRQVKEYYLGNKKVSKENLDRLIKYYGTEMFSFPIYQAQKLSSSKNTVYLYKFTCESERNFFTDIFGVRDLFGSKPVVTHADDLAYLFPPKLANRKVDLGSKCFQMIDNVTKLWTNFAKYGNPTPDNALGVKWKPYTTESEDYLNIGVELEAGSAPDKEEFKFFEDLFTKYLPKK